MCLFMYLLLRISVGYIYGGRAEEIRLKMALGRVKELFPIRDLWLWKWIVVRGREECDFRLRQEIDLLTQGTEVNCVRADFKARTEEKWYYCSTDPIVYCNRDIGEEEEWNLVGMKFQEKFNYIL